MKNKRIPMTIEELRTLELPVILECDDECWGGAFKKIAIKCVGNSKVFVENVTGAEFTFNAEDLSHYPSFKEPKNTRTFYEWIDKEGCVSGRLITKEFKKMDGSCADKNSFLAWTGREFELECEW